MEVRHDPFQFCVVIDRSGYRIEPVDSPDFSRAPLELGAKGAQGARKIYVKVTEKAKGSCSGGSFSYDSYRSVSLYDHPPTSDWKHTIADLGRVAMMASFDRHMRHRDASPRPLFERVVKWITGRWRSRETRFAKVEALMPIEALMPTSVYGAKVPYFHLIVSAYIEAKVSLCSTEQHDMLISAHTGALTNFVSKRTGWYLSVPWFVDLANVTARVALARILDFRAHVPDAECKVDVRFNMNYETGTLTHVSAPY